MFGTLFSAIGKVFTPVVKTVASIPSAIFGVGSAVSTAGAATAAAPLAQGGLTGFINNLTGGGVLGSVLNGAIRQAGVGALIGAGVGAITGQGLGRGALMGAVGGAVTGGLSGAASFRNGQLAQTSTPSVAPAQSPTGLAPTGSTQGVTSARTGLGTASMISAASTQPSTIVTPQQPPRRGLGGMFTKLFDDFTANTEDGRALRGQVLGGIGNGLLMREQERSRMRRLEREIQHEEDKEQRVRDSYSVGQSALHKPMTSTRNSFGSPRYQFNPATGLIE